MFSWGIFVLSALILVPLTVLLAQVAAACLPQSRMNSLTVTGGLDGQQELHRPRIAVLVPAHNEASGIQATLDSIRPQLIDSDRLLVVADNCSDATAAIALDAGAEVIERTDPSFFGKGYALDYGVRYLATTPSRREGHDIAIPDVLIIIDADSEAGTGAIEQLASLCATRNRPVQALYLMSAGQDPGSRGGASAAIAEFAWILKNQVRPLGFRRLGLPCQLMGSGMAMPWPTLQLIALASGDLVEDAQLGLDFARMGLAPLFCPQALIRSRFPNNPEGRQSQRRRWEHGSLSLLIFGIPRYLTDLIGQTGKRSPGGPNCAPIETFHGGPTASSTVGSTANATAGLRAGSTTKCLPEADSRLCRLALALDLCVPPIALLTVMVAAVFAFAIAQVYWLAGS
ncbi:MAG: glycosyltransferase, partial [Betaproteobacteria bacterium]|nr:glycosyltransferase [Betaproteobacteria bacterium]